MGLGFMVYRVLIVCSVPILLLIIIGFFCNCFFVVVCWVKKGRSQRLFVLGFHNCTKKKFVYF